MCYEFELLVFLKWFPLVPHMGDIIEQRRGVLLDSLNSHQPKWKIFTRSGLMQFYFTKHSVPRFINIHVISYFIICIHTIVRLHPSSLLLPILTLALNFFFGFPTIARAGSASNNKAERTHALHCQSPTAPFFSLNFFEILAVAQFPWQLSIAMSIAQCVLWQSLGL